MPHRLPLAIGMIIFLLLSGTMYFASAPDSEHPEYWYEPANLKPEIHQQILEILQTYGLKKEWVSSHEPTGRLVSRPVYKIRIPDGFPFSDLGIELQSLVSGFSGLRLDGFENRRERSVSMHINDGKSVLATYQFHSDSRVKRDASDIYLLVRIPSGTEIPELLHNRTLTSTLLIDPATLSDGQRQANLVSAQAIDFGIYLNGKDPGLRLPARPTTNEFQQVNRKMSVLFPGASLFFTPKEQLKLPVKSPLNYRANSLLSHPNPIKSLADLTYVLSLKKESDYLILMASEEFVLQPSLTESIKTFEKRGYRFRYFRDFNASDYEPAVTKSAASGSKRR